MINQKTKLNMVIGYPLDHTQSPLLHSAIYQALKINAVLLAFPHKNLSSLIKTMKVLSVGFTAVTMPYKEKVVKYLDYCSHEVEILKAANTVIQQHDKLYGYNTDVDGIKYALRHTSLKNKNVLIIGAGGAARAAALVLQKNHANIYFLNRTQSRAKALAKLFGGYIVGYQHLDTLSIDVIINTTPLGMYPNINESPLPNYKFNAKQTVFDMIYHPIDTLLVKRAKKQKAKVISGLDMFIGQGLKQVELFSNKKIQSKKMLADISKILVRSRK